MSFTFSPVDAAIAVLIIAWLIGVVLNLLGKFIHIILIIALVLIAARLIQMTGIFDPFATIGITI